MSTEIKEAIKENVLLFIQAEPGYNLNEAEDITVIKHPEGGWSILYGSSIQMGITGLGASPEDAFDDFVEKWKAYHGF